MKQLALLFILAIGTSVITTTHVSAETIVIPLGSQGAEIKGDLPRKAMKKSSVKEIYGSPLKVTSAVGDPPISTWIYEGFKVFFEYDHVIHSVKNHVPKHPEAMD